MDVNPVSHHLPEAVLMAYAAGTLPEAFSLVAACHISICDDCRAALTSYEALGGAVLEQVEKTEISPDAFAATMALIAKGDAESPTAPAKTAGKLVEIPSRNPSIFPTPLESYVGGGPEAVRWRSVGAGVKQAILPCDRDATARLLYIPAGASMPNHSHNGMELTLVLQGAFSDEVAHFVRGDVELGDEDLHHTPVADPGEDCICLAATDAPLKFNSLLPRLLQPFFRI
jgi:putative transcriptional regulator